MLLCAVIAATGCVATAPRSPLPRPFEPGPPLKVVPPVKPFAGLKDAVDRGALDSEVLSQLQKVGEVSALLVIDHADLISGATLSQRARSPRGEVPVRVFELAYGARKSAALERAGKNAEVINAYAALPVAFVRFRSADALLRTLNDAHVIGVAANRPKYLALATSLPFIRQPQVASWGQLGAGVGVAVIDTGVDFTKAAFGSCTAAGSGCRVVFAQDFAPNDNSNDDNGHGTNVAGIVLGVAPGARILSLDAASGPAKSPTLWDNDILAALNWAAQNRFAFNIRAVNLSVSDGSHWTVNCVDAFFWVNPYRGVFDGFRSAGVMVVVAAGNSAAPSGTFQNGLGNPACTSGALAVGAVYDTSTSSFTVPAGAPSACTDTPATADKIGCFSQSSPSLKIVAPAVPIITAAGISQAGTSQAAPHVSGAVAVIAASNPALTSAQIESALVNNGPIDGDPRNGTTQRRLDLTSAMCALNPQPNDNFSSAQTISGATGSVQYRNWCAGKEPGEPNHAGNMGGASNWFRWSSPFTGKVIFRTLGSKFDTLLGVYTGQSVGSLTTIASNDDRSTTDTTSEVVFNATAGTTFQIAVDGKRLPNTLFPSGGDAKLSWEPFQFNDNVSSATTLTGRFVTITGLNM